VYAPPGVLVLGALVSWGLSGLRVGRWPAVAGCWVALVALVAAWLAVGRQPTEVSPPISATVIPLVLRLDAVALAFGLAALVPLGLLLTFQERTGQEAAIAALAVALAVVAVEAGSLALAALAIGACASLIAVVLREELEEGSRSCWLSVLVSVFVLLGAVAALEFFSGGTSLYSAVPVNALKPQVFLLITVAAVLLAGLLPWSTWVSSIWSRPRLEGAALAIGLLVPLGFLLLVRAYTAGGGDWPGAWLHWLLTGLGALVALAAALRAQGVADRRRQLGEAVPLAGGLALMAISLGTPLGLAAGIIGILAATVGAALGLVLPAGGRVTLLGVPLVVGAPPGLTFGARLLTVEATLAAGGQMALWAIVVGVAWFLGYAAAVRAASLPAGPGAGSRRGTYAASAVVLVAGALLGVLAQAVALPATAELIKMQAPPIAGGVGGVQTAWGGFGSLWLSIPLLVLLLALALLTRPLPIPAEEGRPEAPMLALPAFGFSRWLPETRRVSETLREVTPVDRWEGMMTAGRPWLWAALALVLVWVVAAR
jgi:formate hydrogenlyase subunit 3/multisubunit Na+/H+ antiporter MnhD subunit